jgi:hypothetical protein
LDGLGKDVRDEHVALVEMPETHLEERVDLKTGNLFVENSFGVG